MRAQRLVRKHVKPGTSLVDELIEERARPHEMNRVVLDASAVPAILSQEPGAEDLTVELLSMAATSSVNLAEVQSKLVGGTGKADSWAIRGELGETERKRRQLTSFADCRQISIPVPRKIAKRTYRLPAQPSGMTRNGSEPPPFEGPGDIPLNPGLPRYCF